MTHATATSIRHSITVEAPIERAFAVFTEQFDRIKPREHNMLGVDIAETVFEPRVGGSIYDRGIDGSECRWARVLAYEPPEHNMLGVEIAETVFEPRVGGSVYDRGVDGSECHWARVLAHTLQTGT